MTPLLLAPLGLAALAALAIPLLIHLRRRTEEVPIDFAALRWLDALPRPRSKLRFDEWLLLAIRLLLVALLALLLARPAILGLGGDAPRFLAAPGVDPASARAAAGPDANIRWIAPGFPDFDRASPPSHVPLSSLIRQFDAELPQGARLTIFVPPVIDGVDAEPLHLTRKVTLKVVPAISEKPAAPAFQSPPLAVRHIPGGEAPVRYFRAATAAWSERPRFEAQTGRKLPQPDTVLVWLIPGPVPQAVTDWASKGGTALLAEGADVTMPAAATVVWRDPSGNALVEGAPLGAGRLMRFTKPLEPAAMPDLLSADFAARLRDLVAPTAPPPARVAAAVFAPTAGMKPYPQPARELSAWLGVVIALVFLAERLLAARLRRFAA